MPATGMRPRRDLSKYQGRKLLQLLVLLGVPAAVLYLAIALAVVASESPMSAERSATLLRASSATIAAFAAIQAVAGWLVYRGWARRAATRINAAIACMGVLIVSTCFSVVSAITLEAFGLAILAWVLRGHH